MDLFRSVLPVHACISIPVCTRRLMRNSERFLPNTTYLRQCVTHALDFPRTHTSTHVHTLSLSLSVSLCLSLSLSVSLCLSRVCTRAFSVCLSLSRVYDSALPIFWIFLSHTNSLSLSLARARACSLFPSLSLTRIPTHANNHATHSLTHTHARIHTHAGACGVECSDSHGRCIQAAGCQKNSHSVWARQQWWRWSCCCAPPTSFWISGQRLREITPPSLFAVIMCILHLPTAIRNYRVAVSCMEKITATPRIAIWRAY